MTARSLLAEALGSDERLSHAELVSRVNSLRNVIRERELPVTRQVAGFLAEGVDPAKVVQALLRIPGRLLAEDGEMLRVRRPEVVQYYRHTTEHHFS